MRKPNLSDTAEWRCQGTRKEASRVFTARSVCFAPERKLPEFYSAIGCSTVFRPGIVIEVIFNRVCFWRWPVCRREFLRLRSF